MFQLMTGHALALALSALGMNPGPCTLGKRFYQRLDSQGQAELLLNLIFFFF